MELIFSERQKNLIKIFKKLADISTKYKDYYFFVSNFKLNEDKLLELEKIFEDAKKNLEEFNSNFDSNLLRINSKLQKLKTFKMEKIDMVKEIDEISILLQEIKN